MSEKLRRLKKKIIVAAILGTVCITFLLFATAVAAVCSILPSQRSSNTVSSSSSSNIAPVDVTGMGISSNLIAFLESWEGYDEYPMRGADSWNLTIGYGHVLQGDEAMSEITREEAQDLLITDLKNQGYISFVNKEFADVQLKQNQKDALVSLAYNIGTGGWDHLDLTDDILKGANDSTLEKDFESICNVKDTPLVGLKRRRTAEWIMFTQGKYEMNP